MATLRDIRRRIRSVESTQKITRAMKLVAAAKLRRAQERIIEARPYALKMGELVATLARALGEDKHPLLMRRESTRKLYVVVTADKGLCGAFNSNIIRAAMNAMRERNWNSVELLPIGRKALDYFKRRPIPIRREATQVFQALSLGTAQEIARTLIADFVEEKVDAVYAVYNEFKSIIAQNVRVERLLPIERDWEKATTEVDYLYEPDPRQILSGLLPKHIEFQLYRILLESAAAEQGARMTAMEAATKNASEMIDHLTLTYNRIRQASITKEIIEIVSGAAAAG